MSTKPQDNVSDLAARRPKYPHLNAAANEAILLAESKDYFADYSDQDFFKALSQTMEENEGHIEPDLREDMLLCLAFIWSRIRLMQTPGEEL